jgi:predicted metal-dependent peptidase
VEVAVARTLEEQRNRGHVPAGIKRMFEEILNPEVPWQDHLRTAVGRVAGSGGRNWSRPNRRFIGRDIYLPSPTGFTAGWVVVWGDTSGSISKKELCAYLAELSAILSDTKPKRLTVLWCDAKIHYVDELTGVHDLADITHRGVGGGGGTSVKPCFDWIRENSHEVPDMFIGFTDCCVDFPTEPDYPVIWACVDKEAKPPYGEFIPINQRAQ